MLTTRPPKLPTAILFAINFSIKIEYYERAIITTEIES
jgi:hypothetical protein